MNTVASLPAKCADCGKLYRDFPLDVVLPNDQWQTINGSPNGLLCAACIVERGSKLPGVTVAKLHFPDLATPAVGGGLPEGHPQAPMPAGWLTLAVPGGTESGRDFVHGPRRAIEVCQRALLATPEQPGSAVQGEDWIPVSERLPADGELVMVYTPDSGDGERFDFDFVDDGAWVEHSNQREHFLMVGGPAAAGPDVVCTGPTEEAPYTHWKPVRAPGATPPPAPAATYATPDDVALTMGPDDIPHLLIAGAEVARFPKGSWAEVCEAFDFGGYRYEPPAPAAEQEDGMCYCQGPDIVCPNCEREATQPEARGVEGKWCTYPDCNCPFDAPADPNWCARGLPKANPVRAEQPEGKGAYPTGSDREVLLYLMQQFDAESWECPCCGHSDDCATMDSADYLRTYLASAPAAPVGVEAVLRRIVAEADTHPFNPVGHVIEHVVPEARTVVAQEESK